MDTSRDQSGLVKWSIVAGVIAAVFPIFQRLILLPIYLDSGGKQMLLAQVNRLSSMIVLPGKIIAYRLIPPQAHYFGTSQLILAAAFNLVLYIILTYLILRIVTRIFSVKPQTIEPVLQPEELENKERDRSDIPSSPERRNFLLAAGSSAFGLTIIAAGAYPVFVEPGRLQVRRLTVFIKDLPRSLNGLTIAQLTDFHHDEWISLDHIRRAVNMTNGLNPDIIALTGDYVTSNAALIKPAVQELARLRPRVGTVGVLGNHDFWADADETRKQFAAIDVPLVDNSRLYLTTGRRIEKSADEGLCIAGVGDLWEDEVDPHAALDGVPYSVPRILLSHNPDVAEQEPLLNCGQRVDLMLSGHTHGGQVRLPGIGTPIVPSAYGSKYSQGMAESPVCRVQVSAGIGLALLPVRVNVPPEIVHITLSSSGTV